MTDENGNASEDGAARDSLERLVDDIEERRRSGEAEPRASDSPPERPDAVEDLVEDAEPSPPDPPDASESRRVDVPDFDGLDDARNVLVLGPLREPECDATCAGLLGASAPENALFVTLNHAVENRLEVARSVETPPDRVAVVRVGGNDEAREHSSVSTAGGPDVSVSRVGDPSDLTRVGIAISRCRSQWPEDARAAVCVHSLTELLQYADEQRLFRFVHILQAKLDAPNTAVHFHMDPGAHTRQTLSVFRTLFDAVVEVGDDGAVTLTTGGGE